MLQILNNELLGIVIAGGMSSRMGEQKPTLKVYGEAEPNMLERTAALLGECLGEVWVSCRENQLETSHSCIYDQIEGLGPVGGLHSSLMTIKDTAWQGILVLSCDLPFMNVNIVCGLIKAREIALEAKSDLLMTCYVQEETGYLEPLVAIYEKSALDLFSRAIKDGHRRINLIIPSDFRYEISYATENALPFFNINNPADLAKAHGLIKS